MVVLARTRTSLFVRLAATFAITTTTLPACSDDASGGPVIDAGPDDTTDVQDVTDGGQGGTYTYAVPLDPESPWPKFRRNAVQNGRSPVMPEDSGGDVWVFQTGKGIFSTPVIDGDGNVYVGSADRVFYAIDREGDEIWSFQTGEVVDSSALLDDQGRVFFGSGDGLLYALDRETGDELWRFEADAAEDTGAFINWFEGNVAMGLDGTLFVPNDNFCTYAIDRDDGTEDWCFSTQDQTWSLAALNPETNTLFMGNNFFFFENTYAIDPSDGSEIWNAAAQGTVAASPMLTGTASDDLMVIGGFDGILRAYRQSDGEPMWSFGARDHLYASPGQMADGTIVQPSADGTIYALDPDDGTVVWAYDTREPIRSSPAIDGTGNVYVGSGEGRLFVLNPDGTLRWSIRLVDDLRDDLNASPALGKDFVAIAGESGGIFAVPYDYCLRDGLSDERCQLGPGESLDDDGVFVVYTSSFGGLLLEPPSEIAANQPLAFSLLVREGGDTELALIDSSSVTVTTDAASAPRVDVSGDRKFITVVPNEPWADSAGGALTVQLEGDYLVDLDRDGLLFSGGSVGGSFDETFNFDVASRSDIAFPVPVPSQPGETAGILELYRLAAPLPTILPSYNQIGFDSIHYLVGVVEGDGSQMVGWGIGATLDETGRTVVDPTSRVRFPLQLRWSDGLLTMINEQGFTIEFNGFPLPFGFFRVAGGLDPEGGPIGSPSLNAKAICSEIDFYGQFLQILGFCNPQTDLLDAVGGAELQAHEGGRQTAPAGVGTVAFAVGDGNVTATLTDSALVAADHNLGLLLVDTATSIPVPLNYTTGSTATATAEGLVETVVVDIGGTDLPDTIRVYLMVDAYPAALDTIDTTE